MWFVSMKIPLSIYEMLNLIMVAMWGGVAMVNMQILPDKNVQKVNGRPM